MRGLGEVLRILVPGAAELTLSYCNISDELADALSDLPIPRICVSGNNIGSSGAHAFSESPHLRRLDISFNPIMDDGARHLARSDTINVLNVGGCGLTDAGAIALAGSPRLQSLYIANNNIGDASAVAFARNANIRHLDISNTRIGDMGIATLADSNTIESLVVSGIDLTAIARISLRQLRKKRPHVTIVGLDGGSSRGESGTAGCSTTVWLERLGINRYERGR